MSVIVNLQPDILDGKGPEFLEILKGVLPDTRAFDGCHWVYVCSAIDDPDKIEAISLWDSKEHYDTYLKWRMDNGLMDAIGPFLAGDPVFRFLNNEQAFV